MAKEINRQIALNPIDLFVLFKVAAMRGEPWTYAQVGMDLRIAASQVHTAFSRGLLARLLSKNADEIRLDRAAFTDFVLFGARYVYPAISGSTTRGIPTSYAAPPLNELIAQTDQLPPIWPDPDGTVRGIALYPLHVAAPRACIRDPALYELLALFDALRSGGARERELAKEMLRTKL